MFSPEDVVVAGEVCSKYLFGVRVLGGRLVNLSIGVCFCFAQFPVTQAYAITVRGDRAPIGIWDYWDEDNEFANVGNIMADRGSSFSNHCTGTLINSRTIITAAHCVVDDDNDPSAYLINNGYGVSFDANSYGKTESTFGNNDYGVSGSVAHDEYRSGRAGQDVYDIALISLDEPVDNLSPAQLAGFVPGAGTEIVLVGYGTSGSIGVDPTYADGEGKLNYFGADDRRRIAGNYIDYSSPITADFIAASGGNLPADTIGGTMLFFDVDDPAAPRNWLDGSVDATVHEYEGGTAPGDSGGPLFVRQNGELLLAGLSNSGGAVDPTQPDGGYSNVVLHVPVGVYSDWIAANNPLRTASAAAGTGSWNDASFWSESVVPDNGEIACQGTGCKQMRYYDVVIDKASTLDVQSGAYEVDSLSLNNADASLMVASGADLTTERSIALANGNVQVHGRFGADDTFSLGNSARLSGTGSIGSDEGIEISGTIAPGASIGTLSMTGPVAFGSGATLEIEGDGTSADRVSMDNAVTISGGGVVYQPSASGNAPQSAYTIVDGATSISGTFDTVISSSVFFSTELTYGAADISLTATRNISGVAGNSIQTKAAKALEAGLQSGNANAHTLFNSLIPLSESDGRQALQDLGGASAANGTQTVMGGVNTISSVLRQAHHSSGSGNVGASQSSALGYAPVKKTKNMDAAFDAVDNDTSESTLIRTALWAKALAGRGFYDGTGGSTGTTTTTGGLLAGVQFEPGDDTFFGAFTGYTATNSAQGTDSTDLGTVNFGVYGETGIDAWTLSGAAHYGYQMFDSRRRVTVGGTANIAKGDYNGHAFSISGEVSRALLSSPELEFAPYAGLDMHHIKLDGYTETGAGAANLTVAGSDTTLVYGNVGARISRAFDFSGFKVRPELAAGWRRSLTNPSNDITASLAGQSLDIEGSKMSRDALAVGAGLEATYGSGIALEARYDGQIAGSFSDHQASLRLKIPFL